MSWKDLFRAGRRDAHVAEDAQADRDTDDELLFHLRSLVDENMDRGMSREEAWNEAEKQFGSLRGYWIACRRTTLAHGRLVPGLIGGLAVLLLVVGWLAWETRSLRQQQRSAPEASRLATQAIVPEPNADHRDLEGRVFDSRGKPIAGADVFVILKTWPGGWFRQDNYFTKSNAQGRFLLRRLIPPDGQFAVQVAALKDGYALTSDYQLKEADEDRALDPIVLRMNDASPLTLVVNDLDGRPVPGAQVVLSVRHSAAGGEHLLYFQGSEPAHREANSKGQVPLHCLERGDTAQIYVRVPNGDWNLHAVDVPHKGDRIEVSATPTEPDVEEQTSINRSRVPVRMVSAQSRRPVREEWAAKLAALQPDKALDAFSIGQALAGMPPDEGYQILAENWHRIGQTRARKLLLEAWAFTAPEHSRPPVRNHRRLLDVLNLGMHDGPEVRATAATYLRRVALRDFSEDAAGYEAWYADNHNRPLADVAVMSVRQFVASLVAIADRPRTERMRLFRDAENLLHDNLPGVRQAAIDAGLVDVVDGWAIAAVQPDSDRAAIETAESGLQLLAQLELPEAELRRVVVPLTSKQTPSGMRAAAISALARPEFRWAVDVIIDALQQAVAEDSFAANSIVWAAADALGEIGDPRAIPPLIAVVDTRGVGIVGLIKLSGLDMHDHVKDGTWWRGWWEQNKRRYPEVAQQIPNYRRVRAKLPPDVEFDNLALNWPRIGPTYARQSILKSYFFRRHPRRLDVLDLGMRDVAEVRDWAETYLYTETLLDFSDDFAAYETWWEVSRTKTRDEVDRDTGRRFAALAARIEPFDDQDKHRDFVSEAYRMLRRAPAARQAALDAGALAIVEPWLDDAVAPQASRPAAAMAASLLDLLAVLELPEAELCRVVLPFTSSGNPAELRRAAIPALARKEFPWAAELLRSLLSEADPANDADTQIVVRAAAAALAEIGDTTAIPLMIAAMEADNTQQLVYGVGRFGLGKLTGVKYDKGHDAAWWRAWWEKNKHQYVDDPPDDTERGIVAKGVSFRAQDDVADVPSQDIRIGDDPKKRYFLIGDADKDQAPADGYKLLFVLPGGDGSADFNPFVKRIYKYALDPSWLVAQPVAPEWDKKQFERIVWPTAKARYPAAKFTTERLVADILGDVRSRVPLDPRTIFMLGWSSGGPPVYATTTIRKSPITGAFVAMSIFVPGDMPALSGAKGKAFYLLQSPEDQVTKFFFATRAEKVLAGAGAKVKLERYPGGHGWRGNVYGMIRGGIGWLEENTGRGDGAGAN